MTKKLSIICFISIAVPAQRHLSEVNKSVNLLADLASRFDVEQEALVSWLQLPEVKSLPSKAKHVQMTRLAAEKYLAVAEASHETALLAVGLLERLEESRLVFLSFDDFIDGVTLNDTSTD